MTTLRQMGAKIGSRVRFIEDPEGQWRTVKTDADLDYEHLLPWVVEDNTRIEELEAKIRTYEQRDEMDGAVVSAIRDLLNHHNVPLAAFIDDHVGNAIRQRNIAEDKLALVIAAYRIEAMRRDDYSHDAFDQHIAALKGQNHE